MKYFGALLTSIQVANALKIAAVSDAHMFPMYEPTKGSSGFCWPDSSASVLDVPAYFG
jgi:hypothetical protein